MRLCLAFLPTISTTLSNLSIESKLWAFGKEFLLSPFVFDHVLNLNHDVLFELQLKLGHHLIFDSLFNFYSAGIVTIWFI